MNEDPDLQGLFYFLAIVLVGAAAIWLGIGLYTLVKRLEYEGLPEVLTAVYVLALAGISAFVGRIFGARNA